MQLGSHVGSSSYSKQFFLLCSSYPSYTQYKQSPSKQGNPIRKIYSFDISMTTSVIRFCPVTHFAVTPQSETYLLACTILCQTKCPTFRYHSSFYFCFLKLMHNSCCQGVQKVRSCQNFFNLAGTLLNHSLKKAKKATDNGLMEPPVPLPPVFITPLLFLP